MTATGLDVSVIICTRNRALQLTSVLASAAGLDVPAGLAWEFLVVDNGSSDNTEEVVRSFADRLPIRYCREDMPGLSNARNCGVRAARGRYICWTDDDVLIDRRWLAAYVAAFGRHPDAVVFGGRVLPRLEGAAAPAWFVENHLATPIASPMAYRDLGDQECPLTFKGNRVPYGANYAVRTAEQRAALYDPGLGVSPNHKRLGEEVDVIHRMMKSGATAWWVPEALVQHIIPPARQTASYIYEYYFLAGATFAYVAENKPADNYFIVAGQPAPDFEFPRWRCFRRSLGKYLAYRRMRRRGDIGWVSMLAELGYYLGMGSYKTPAEKFLLGLKKSF